MLTLADKTCIITGAASGIGEKTSRLFESLGAKVIALDINEEKGKKLEQASKQGRISFMKIDLRDRDQLEEFAKWARKLDRIDVLINNAVTVRKSALLDITLDDWDAQVAVSLTAPLLLSRVAASKMIEKRIRGKIIMISAVQARLPLTGFIAYSTVKGGMISMTRGLAAELGENGISVMAVLPGPIYTAGDNESDEPPEDIDSNAATLLRRMGRRGEVANLLAFLASDSNSFMTGNTIVIDGGRSISRSPDPPEIGSGAV